MSCGVDRRLGSDPVLLWLWCRLVATAPIRPLAWEPTYAMGSALKKGKKTKRQKDKKKKKTSSENETFSRSFQIGQIVAIQWGWAFWGTLNLL